MIFDLCTVLIPLAAAMVLGTAVSVLASKLIAWRGWFGHPKGQHWLTMWDESENFDAS